jgi:hypothetical protein
MKQPTLPQVKDLAQGDDLGRLPQASFEQSRTGPAEATDHEYRGTATPPLCCQTLRDPRNPVDGRVAGAVVVLWGEPQVARISDGRIQLRSERRRIFGDYHLPSRRKKGAEGSLMIIDYLVKLPESRDDNGPAARSQRFDDGKRSALGDHRCGIGEEPLEFCVLEVGDATAVSRRARGAMLDHAVHAVSRVAGEPGIHPLDQPVEAMVVGADRDDD